MKRMDDPATLVPYYVEDEQLKPFDFGDGDDDDDAAGALIDEELGSDGQSIPDEDLFDAVNEETFGAQINALTLTADDDLADFAIRTANLVLFDDEPTSSTPMQPPDPSQIPMPRLGFDEPSTQRKMQQRNLKKEPMEMSAAAGSSIWASGSFNGIGSLGHLYQGHQLKTESQSQKNQQQQFPQFIGDPDLMLMLPSFGVEPSQIGMENLIKPMAKSPKAQQQQQRHGHGQSPLTVEELERKILEEAAATRQKQQKSAAVAPTLPTLPAPPQGQMDSAELERQMFQEAAAAQQQQQQQMATAAATLARHHQIQQKQAMMAQAMMAAHAAAMSQMPTATTMPMPTTPGTPMSDISGNAAAILMAANAARTQLSTPFPPPPGMTPPPPQWYQQLMQAQTGPNAMPQMPPPPPSQFPQQMQAGGPHLQQLQQYPSAAPTPQMPSLPQPPPNPQLFQQWQQQIQQAFAAAAAAGAGMTPAIPPPPGIPMPSSSIPPMMPFPPHQYFMPPPGMMAHPQNRHQQQQPSINALALCRTPSVGPSGGAIGHPTNYRHSQGATMNNAMSATPISPTKQMVMVPASLHPRVEKQRRQKVHQHPHGSMPSGKTISDYALDPYAGLMSTKEREWLIKIQIIQCLGTGDQMEDDFYYTVWKQRNVLAKAPEQKKETPKYYKFEATFPSMAYNAPSFMGALGRPVHSSSRIPRQIIEVINDNAEEESTSSGSAGGKQTAAHRQKRLRGMLMKIENAALMLIDCRLIRRKLRFFKDTCITEFIDKSEITDRLARFEENLAHVEASIFTADQLPTVMLIQKGRQFVYDWLHFMLSENAADGHQQLLAQMRVVIAGMAKFARKVPDDSLEAFIIGFCSLFMQISPKNELLSLFQGAKLEPLLIRDSKLVQLTLLTMLVSIIHGPEEEEAEPNATYQISIEHIKETPIGTLLLSLPAHELKMGPEDADDLALFSAGQWALLREWLLREQAKSAEAEGFHAESVAQRICQLEIETDEEEDGDEEEGEK